MWAATRDCLVLKTLGSNTITETKGRQTDRQRKIRHGTPQISDKMALLGDAVSLPSLLNCASALSTVTQAFSGLSLSKHIHPHLPSKTTL